MHAFPTGFNLQNVVFTDTQVEDDFIDPIQKKTNEIARNRIGQQRVSVETENRLRELRIDAELNEEKFSEVSANDLRQFLKEIGAISRPAIFLLDNGNVRAVWRNEQNEQIALQFLGNTQVQFVIFFRRPQSTELFRQYGTDIMSAIRGMVEIKKCAHLFRG